MASISTNNPSDQTDPNKTPSFGDPPPDPRKQMPSPLTQEKDVNPIDWQSKSIRLVEGEPQYTFVEAEVKIPNELKQKLTNEEIKNIEQQCLEKFSESQAFLDESMADVFCSNRFVKEHLQASCSRLLKTLETYAKIQLESKNKEKPSEMTFKFALNRLLADIFLDRSSKTHNYAGQVGSNPIAIKKALESGNFREQMFLLLYAKKGVMGTIAKNQSLIDQINKKLADDGESWSLIADPTIDEDAIYAAETDRLQLRTTKKSKQDITSPSIGDPLLRVPLSDREKRYVTKQPVVIKDHEKEKTNWGSGSSSYDPRIAEGSHEDPPYLEIAKKLHLNLVAGISGTTDQVLSIMRVLGQDTLRDMALGRMGCLGWFIDTHSHSSYEVLTSSKSFGLPFTPAPDSYKNIPPEDLKTEIRVCK